MARKDGKVRASEVLGVYTAPYTNVWVDPPAGEYPYPGSPNHKRFAESIIGAARSESQRAAQHLAGAELRSAYNAGAEGMVESLMYGFERLLRERYGSSFAERVGDMDYPTAMGELESAVGEIAHAARESLREWRSSNPKSPLEAPEIA